MYDLTLGTRDGIVANGHARDRAMLRRYEHDFFAINEILEAAIPECLDLLQRRYDCPVSRVASILPPTRRAVVEIVLRVLEVWRERVWTNVLELLTAQPGVEMRVRGRMARLSGDIARVVAGANFGRPMPVLKPGRLPDLSVAHALARTRGNRVDPRMAW